MHTLTPPLLKELLFSYAYNTTSSTTDGMPPQHQQPLQGLLPILSKLCNSRTTTPPFSPKTEFLWLPLPMSLLRKLAVDLLAQRRSADALALLSCVHPLQWPYDALLTALATEGGASRIKACESILLQRQKLVVDVGGIRRGTSAVVGSGGGNNLDSSMGVTAGVNMGVSSRLSSSSSSGSSSSGSSNSLGTSVDREGGGMMGLSPIRGSTARALLAMALQRPGASPQQTPVVSDIVDSDSSASGGSGSGSGSGTHHSNLNNGRAGEDPMTDNRSDFVTTMNSIRTLVAKAVAQTSSNCDTTNAVRTRPRRAFNYDGLNIQSTTDVDLADLQRCDTPYQHTPSTHGVNTPYQYVILMHSLNTPYQLTLLRHPIINTRPISFD